MYKDGTALTIGILPSLRANIVFNSGAGPEITFEWKDSMFNVIYDADKCTQAAKNFLECILPYLNEYIKAEAEELRKESNGESIS